MNKAFSYILTILITALIVGGGVWQLQTRAPQLDQDVIVQEEEDNTIEAIDNLEVAIGHNADASFKRYTNKKYNFTFEYPLNFIYDEGRLWSSSVYELTGYPNRMDFSTMSIEIEELKDKTFDWFITDHVGGVPPTNNIDELAEILQYERIKLGDNEFVKINGDGLMDLTFYYVKHNNLTIAFTTFWYDDEENEEFKKIQRILSSLKFE